MALSLLRMGGGCAELAKRLAPALKKKLALLAPKLPAETHARLATELEGTALALAPIATSSAGPATGKRPRRSEEDEDASATAHERLSESRLWSASRSYYVSRGLAAFASGEVPHHVSSNAFVAGGYADVVAAFARDAAKADGDGDGDGDDRTRYIVELGCGSGVLAVRLCAELCRRADDDEGGDARFCVVLADLDPSAALAQLALPHAAPLVARGMLDAARIGTDGGDVEAGAPLRLLLSGRVVDAGSLATPLTVVANYLFDSLPIDAFRWPACAASASPEAVLGGATTEALVPVAGERESEGTHERLAWKRLPPGGAARHLSQGDRKLLLRCLSRAAEAASPAGSSDGAAAAVVPTGSARLLRWLAALRRPPQPSSPSASLPPPLLLLVGDKMVAAAEEGRLLRADAPEGLAMRLGELPLFDRHGGAVSHAVCLEAIRDALSLSAADDEADCPVVGLRSRALLDFDVAALLLPGGEGGRGSGGVAWRQTRCAFARRLGGFGAAEWQTMLSYAAELAATGRRPPSRAWAAAATALLRCGGCDWDAFVQLRWWLAASARDTASALAGGGGWLEDAVAVAVEGFRRRVGTDASRRAHEAARLQLGEWLHVVGRPEAALEVLRLEEGGEDTGGGGGGDDRRHAAERSFLRAICLLQLHGRSGASDEAVRLLAAAAAQEHRGARRRLRRVLAFEGEKEVGEGSCGLNPEVAM